MAVPTDVTTLDLSGKFIINKTVSETSMMDQILSLQGVPWLLRKGITVGTVTFNTKHYKNDDGVECIDVTHTITGGIRGTSEERVLDGKERPHKDYILGATIGWTKRTTWDDDTELHGFSKSDWTKDSLEKGLILDMAYSDTPKSKNTWQLQQLWGLQEVQGERRYTRHILFTGPQGQIVEAKMYYDYTGPI